MPCKGGFRKNIEESKLRRTEEKNYRESPAGRHWQWLVQHVQEIPGGFDDLTETNQAYFAVGLLEGEVYNGGFDQYFFNRAADYYSSAVRGLIEMGDTKTLRLLIDAKEIVFGVRPVPTSTATRRNLLRSIAGTEAQAKERFSKLEAIDALFWKDPDNLSQRASQFAERHGLRADF